MRIWLLKYCKRFLRQKFFLILLLAMPVGTLWFAYLAHQDQTTVRVGIMNEQRNVFGAKVEEELLKHQGIIQFCSMSSEKEMKQAIQQGELECGYLFPANMEEKYKNHQYAGVVAQYYRKGSLFHTIAREVVLTGFFRQYGKIMVDEYIHESGFFRTENITEHEVTEQYQENLKNQETFSIFFDNQTNVKNQLGDYLVAPIRGVLALLILLAGFCGLSLYYEDRRRELPAALPGTAGKFLSFLTIAVPVLLVSAAGIVSEFVCGFGFLSLKEIAYMLIYDIIVVLFCNMLSFAGMQEGTLWVSALGYVCASAIFTPVFINMSALLPGVQWISCLCLPYYFLNAVFGGSRELMQMFVLLLVLLGLNQVMKRRGRRVDSVVQRQFIQPERKTLRNGGKDDYKL